VAVESDAPGPGDYRGAAQSFLAEASENPSWGKRGMGGFASRSVRFGARSTPCLPRPGRGVPGPGAYDSQVALSDPMQSKSSAAFLGSGRPGGAAGQQGAKVPGPGDYNLDARGGRMHYPSCNSAFNSETRRISSGNAGAASMPGPGEYRADVAPSLATVAAAMQENAIFSRPSQRRIARVHRDLPAVGDRGRRLLGDFGSQVGRQCVGVSGTFVPPGPGHYPSQRGFAEPAEAELQQPPATSSFAPGGGRTEQVPREKMGMPGPDVYDAKRPALDKLTSANSAFNSGTQRLDDLRPPPAPGPCYYSPTLPKAGKSFMLNVKKEWRG